MPLPTHTSHHSLKLQRKAHQFPLCAPQYLLPYFTRLVPLHVCCLFPNLHNTNNRRCLFVAPVLAMTSIAGCRRSGNGRISLFCSALSSGPPQKEREEGKNRLFCFSGYYFAAVVVFVRFVAAAVAAETETAVGLLSPRQQEQQALRCGSSFLCFCLFASYRRRRRRRRPEPATRATTPLCFSSSCLSPR